MTLSPDLYYLSSARLIRNMFHFLYHLQEVHKKNWKNTTGDFYVMRSQVGVEQKKEYLFMLFMVISRRDVIGEIADKMKR